MNLPMTRRPDIRGTKASAPDAFLGGRPTGSSPARRSVDVADQDRLGIRAVRPPRRMAFESRAVAIGEPAPCDKAHDAFPVEKQDRSTTSEDRDDAVESGVKRLRPGAGVIEPVRHPVKGGELLHLRRRVLAALPDGRHFPAFPHKLRHSPASHERACRQLVPGHGIVSRFRWTWPRRRAMTAGPPRQRHHS